MSIKWSSDVKRNIQKLLMNDV